MTGVRATARIVGAPEAARAIREVRTEVPRAAGDELQAVADVGEQSMRSAAPKGSTRALERGIAQYRVGRGAQTVIEISATARNPQTGYDYVGVTRFGHRAARIYPRTDRAPASVVATRRPRATGGNAALRFVIGGRVFYRKWVRGYHPASDWSDRGVPPTVEALDVATSRLGALAARLWRQ